MYKKLLLLTLCPFLFHSSFAANQSSLNFCPSVSYLRNFNPDLTLELPLSFDAHTEIMNFGLFKIRKFPRNQASLFVLSAIPTHVGEDPENIAASLMNTLLGDTITPVTYEEDGLTMQLCTYSSFRYPEFKGLFVRADDVNTLAKSRLIPSTVKEQIKAVKGSSE